MDSIVSDPDLVEAVFRKIGADLEAILDHEISFEEVRYDRLQRRVAGEGRVHISFKLGIDADGERQHGCVLIPLPDAISMACLLMMLPDQMVAESRDLDGPDEAMKEALLEVGNFVAGATDVVLREWMPEGVAVRFEGCQGVRADVRPAFPYEEGSELIVGWVQARIDTFPPFEMILMLPRLSILV